MTLAHKKLKKEDDPLPFTGIRPINEEVTSLLPVARPYRNWSSFIICQHSHYLLPVPVITKQRKPSEELIVGSHGQHTMYCMHVYSAGIPSILPVPVYPRAYEVYVFPDVLHAHLHAPQTLVTPHDASTVLPLHCTETTFADKACPNTCWQKSLN